MKVNKTYYQLGWTGGIFGSLNSVDGIVIHDASAGINATAQSVAQYTTNRMKADPDSANYHYVLDATSCYQLIGEQYATYSLGDKDRSDNYYPNDRFISVEIAPSLTGGTLTESDKDKYYKAWLNTCKFVAEICVRKKLSSSKIYQHNKYGSTSCPYTMAKYFGSYEKALAATRKQVQVEMDKLKGGSMKYKSHYKKLATYNFANRPNGQTTLYIVELTSLRNKYDAKTGKKVGVIKPEETKKKPLLVWYGGKNKNGHKKHCYEDKDKVYFYYSEDLIK